MTWWVIALGVEVLAFVLVIRSAVKTGPARAHETYETQRHAAAVEKFQADLGNACLSLRQSQAKTSDAMGGMKAAAEKLRKSVDKRLGVVNSVGGGGR